MKGTITVKGKEKTVDFSKPHDISIPMRAGIENVNAWYVDPVKITPVKAEGFIGAVAQGGSVNFRDIDFNPHGNGTHTECVGHIASTVYSVNKSLTHFFYDAQLITIEPETYQGKETVYRKEGDKIIQGADAFLILWKKIPKYKFLYKFFKLPIIYNLFSVGYELVAFFLYLKNKKQLKN